MSLSGTNRRLDLLSKCFQVLTLSEKDWPVTVTAAIADARALAFWPDFPLAATMEHQRLGHGRGIDPDAARRAAVGELVEIASCCDWGDLPMQWHSPVAVGRDGWAPDRLNGFSGAQRAARADWNRSMDGLDWIPPDPDPHQPIGWLLANEQTTGRDVLVPADAVVIGRKEIGDPDAVSVADTNGCAAAPTLDAARLSALLELVERDATGLWWYGCQPCHVVKPETDQRYRAIAQHLHERARQILVLDITSDIRIPTLVAIAADLDGSHLIMGFGCRLSRHDALQVALIELMQIELKLAMAREEDLELPDLEPWFQEVGMIDVPSGPGSVADDQFLMRDQEESRLPVAQCLDICIQRIERAGCAVAFLDFTRPKFEIPVCRAISPDLCHWKPRLGRARIPEADAGRREKLLRV